MAAPASSIHRSFDWDRHGELSILFVHGFSVDEAWDGNKIPFGDSAEQPADHG